MRTEVPNSFNVAIIGGGITGSCAARSFLQDSKRAECKVNVKIDLFDQGRRGVGGRSSDRAGYSNEGRDPLSVNMRWDHGCQFFRADTDRFKSVVNELIVEGIVKEWTGDFRSTFKRSESNDFFGFPSSPPFYVGTDGMQSVSKGILDQLVVQNSILANEGNGKNSNTSSNLSSNELNLFTGTRVASIERSDGKWKLWGTSGNEAFHDTPEKEVQQSNESLMLGEGKGYDAIILTDVSSSFGKWHRASAGVPESFASRVRERTGARTPLFTAMIAFESKSEIPFDAATFDNDILWFASKSNSKPGMGGNLKECWTLISTPDYAVEKIEETPMQDPETGEFLPQTKEYLTTVPGPDLIAAFCNDLTSKNGILGNDSLSIVPRIIHVDAQRWGSAIPCPRHLDEHSSTRKVICGVPYESGRSALAPTKVEKCRNEDYRNFLVDEELMLLQAGDMVSTFTPGFESAAISGIDAAVFCLETFAKRVEHK